jgi:hypothetical protein
MTDLVPAGVIKNQVSIMCRPRWLEPDIPAQGAAKSKPKNTW